MAIKTLDLDEIEKITPNIYEACLVIAKRAREINAERIAKRKEKEIMEEAGYESEEGYLNRDMEEVTYEKEINPTVIAQEEFFNRKLKIRYKSQPEKKESTE